MYTSICLFMCVCVRMCVSRREHASWHLHAPWMYVAVRGHLGCMPLPSALLETGSLARCWLPQVSWPVKS